MHNGRSTHRIGRPFAPLAATTSSTPWQIPRPLRRQVRMPCQIPIHTHRRLTPLTDAPHHQRLTPMHVASREQPTSDIARYLESFQIEGADVVGRLSENLYQGVALPLKPWNTESHLGILRRSRSEIEIDRLLVDAFSRAGNFGSASHLLLRCFLLSP